jgi:hypothetical protein
VKNQQKMSVKTISSWNSRNVTFLIAVAQEKTLPSKLYVDMDIITIIEN